MLDEENTRRHGKRVGKWYIVSSKPRVCNAQFRKTASQSSNSHSLIMKSFFAAVALPALVAAHGHVDKVIADGKEYQGWNAALKYQNPIPATVGWQADNLDNGFVSPDSFGKSDIACHKQGKSNGASVPVKPGSKVTFKWVRSLPSTLQHTSLEAY
jgi:hypothetical protein